MSCTAALCWVLCAGIMKPISSCPQVKTGRKVGAACTSLVGTCVGYLGRLAGPSPSCRCVSALPRIGERGSLCPGLCPLPAAAPCSLGLRPRVRWRPTGAPEGSMGLWGCTAPLVNVTDGDSKGQCRAGGRMFGGECNRDAARTQGSVSCQPVSGC